MDRGLVLEDGSVASGFADGSAVLLSGDGSGVVCLEASGEDGDIFVLRHATRYVPSRWRARACEAVALRNAFAVSPFACKRTHAASGGGARGPDLARWSCEGGVATAAASSATAEVCAYERLCLVRYGVKLAKEDIFDAEGSSGGRATAAVERLVAVGDDIDAASFAEADDAKDADALVGVAAAVAASARTSGVREVAAPLPKAVPAAAAATHVSVATAAERAAGAWRAGCMPAYEALSVAGAPRSYYETRAVVEYAQDFSFLAIRGGRAVEARLHPRPPAPGGRGPPVAFAAAALLAAPAAIVVAAEAGDCRLLRVDGADRVLPLSALGACPATATWLLPRLPADAAAAVVSDAALRLEAFLAQLRRRSATTPAPALPTTAAKLDATPVEKSVEADCTLTSFADGRARAVALDPPVVLELDAAAETLDVLHDGDAYRTPAARPPPRLSRLAAKLRDFQAFAKLSPADRQRDLAAKRRHDLSVRTALASSAALAVGLRQRPPPAPAAAAGPLATPPTRRRPPPAPPATASVHTALKSTSDFLASLRAAG